MQEEKYLLSKEQLEFIRFLSDRVGTDSVLKDRLNNCIATLSKVRQTSDQKENLLLVHSPQKTIDLFYQFSKNDDLKWFTHKWDRPEEDYNIYYYINKQPDNFKLLNEYFYGENAGVPLHIINHLKNFINLTEKGFFIFDQFGKRFPYLWIDTIKWCQEHPGKWPGNMPTDDGRIFETWIKNFKQTIEFRRDVDFDQKFGVQIKKFIKSLISQEVAKVTYTEDFLKIGRNIGFYCYVNGLFQGLSKIFNWIEDYKALSNKVTIDLEQAEDGYNLVIHHLNSFFSCEDNKLNGLGGDLKELRERLFSVCDLIIEANRENQSPIRVVCLDNETQGSFSVRSGKNQITLSPCRFEPLETSPNGVKYILKLYKK